ncbi:MAG: AAA family ATPase [Acholeplasmatales bacterium]|jgi:uncharacterized protein YPO0396|nr:AAA family ATPase [Acholeplasmatales bacterium]
MKRLTKIKLINWHSFLNETVEINENTLISGENGAGKTTFLDAIQYVLVGGKGGVKFNIAATEDAKRDLEGYVRGKTGVEGKDALRTGDVITHVCLEFFDNIKKEHSLIGSVIELTSGNTLREKSYFMEYCAIDEAIFLDNNKPRDYKSMKAYFKSQFREFDYFDSQKVFKESIGNFFGMDAVKYSKILPKALAFRAVDLQKFVYDFLLDDKPIDISSLKNNTDQLRKINILIEDAKKRLEKLEELENTGIVLLENKNTLSINSLIEHINFIEKREEFIKQASANIARLESLIDNERHKQEEIERLQTENDSQILALKISKDSNDFSRTLTALNESLRKSKDEYNKALSAVTEVGQTLDEELKLYEELNKKFPSKQFSAFTSYYKANPTSFSISQITTLLTNVNAEKEGLINSLTIRKDRLSGNKNDLISNINASNNRVNNMERSEAILPNFAVNLINLLNRELGKLHNKEFNLVPFCELIEINDEKWRNALEGILSTNRFDILIEPMYYEEAKKIYDTFADSLGIYGAGIANVKELERYTDFKPNSLASKVDTENKYARLYANYKLGNIITVEKREELENYSYSVTPSCFVYQSYVARRINPRVYAEKHIGKGGLALQAEIEKSELVKYRNELNNINNEINIIDSNIKLLYSSKVSILLNQNRFGAFTKINDLNDNIIALENRLNILGSDATGDKLDKEIVNLESSKKELQIKHNNIVGQISVYKQEKNSAELNIVEANKTLSIYQEEHRTLELNKPELLSDATAKYKELQKKYRTFEDIVSYINDSNAKLNTLINRGEAEVISMMRHYNNTFHFGAEPTVEYFNLYLAEKNTIKNQNLVTYRQEANELYHNALVSFREDFVNKLRDSIDQANQQISELNFALSEKKFGNDSYQLLLRASEDPDFKTYYNIIMTGNPFEDNDSLFIDGLSKKNANVLMELFNKIADPAPVNDKLATQCLDYRNYMSYDIEITNMNNEKIYFSKVSKVKSGGETQVPFYIVIAASFQQLLSKNKKADSGVVVLFDEAFNNMDDSRIEAMMRFYNSLAIQLFISVPPQRVPNIISYVNTALTVVKHNDVAYIGRFEDTRDKL